MRLGRALDHLSTSLKLGIEARIQSSSLPGVWFWWSGNPTRWAWDDEGRSGMGGGEFNLTINSSDIGPWASPMIPISLKWLDWDWFVDFPQRGVRVYADTDPLPAANHDGVVAGEPPVQRTQWQHLLGDD